MPVVHCVYAGQLYKKVSRTWWNGISEECLHDRKYSTVLCAGHYVSSNTIRTGCVQDPTIPTKALVTDECTFTRGGITNFTRGKTWTQPVSIIEDDLTGPCILLSTFTGPRYLQIICRQLLRLSEDALQRTGQGVWFLYDGSPAHFSPAVWEWLGRYDPGQWIGRVSRFLCRGYRGHQTSIR
jgi:hypothetical protein